MRILHILDHSIPLHSGYTFRTRAILREQHALGLETDHITSSKHHLVTQTNELEESVDGLHFFRTHQKTGLIANLPVVNQWAVSSALEKRLYEVIPKVRPDILHAHSPALNGLAAVKVGKYFGIPVVYEIRAFWEDAAVDHGTSKEWGIRYRLTRALETRVLKHADKVTTICEGLRSDIMSRGVAKDKVVVIPNAVDLDKFTLSSDRDGKLLDKLGLQGKVVLGFIGSFYAYEGLEVLLKALPKILVHRPDARVLLVGGGPEEIALKSLVKKMSLVDKVVFTGRVPHEDVQCYYDLVDIFTYPRLSMRLTNLVTPLKPLEAMARGRLVVASDVGGHKELIQDGVTGKLFPAGNSVALAEAVLNLLANKESWEGYRVAGREFVEKERNWPVSVARYIPIYQSLIKNSSL